MSRAAFTEVEMMLCALYILVSSLGTARASTAMTLRFSLLFFLSRECEFCNYSLNKAFPGVEVWKLGMPEKSATGLRVARNAATDNVVHTELYYSVAPTYKEVLSGHGRAFYHLWFDTSLGSATSRWLGNVSLRSFPRTRPDPIERRQSSLTSRAPIFCLE